MRDFKHWPLAIAVAVIVLTLVICTERICSVIYAANWDAATYIVSQR